jgi:hypothetical protein
MKIRAKLLIPLAALFSSAGVKPRFMETNARINAAGGISPSIQSSRMKAALFPLASIDLLGGALLLLI